MPAVASPSTKGICLLRGNIRHGQAKMSNGRFSGVKAENEWERREIQYHVAANSTYRSEVWPHTCQWLQQVDRFVATHLRERANCSLLCTIIIIIIIIVLKEAFHRRRCARFKDLLYNCPAIHWFTHLSRKYLKGSNHLVDLSSDMRIILNE